jgi:hypothetical protein
VNELKLYMLLLGCKPPGRNTEQHDVFFGIAQNIKDLAPAITSFWPEANGKIHLDGWRELTQVDDYDIRIEIKDAHKKPSASVVKLFFINLGGYKPGEFEEFHYKMVMACKDKGEAISEAKRSAFYKHTGFAGAGSHVDDKYGVDVDDLYEIADILPPEIKQQYSIILTERVEVRHDSLQLGYMMLSKL